MTRSVRVLGLVPYPPAQVPSQRFRVEQWMPLLGALGIECTLASFFDGDLYRRLGQPGKHLGKVAGLLRAAGRRWKVMSEIGACDLIFLHREAIPFGPALLERVLARRKPVVFDFDDAIWLRSQNPANPLAAWVKCVGKVDTIARLASAITVGNSYLADWARGRNRSTFVVPTTIDTDGAYGRRKAHGRTEVPVIGWSGSTSTLRYLEFLRPVLEQLACRRRFRLLITHNGPPGRWAGIDVDWRPWVGEREVDDLLEFDIGLMPQPEEEWAKGKCGLKALQYMALGIPPVASRNGVLPEIIEDGRSGYLAGTPGEWLDRLESLLDDWKLRAVMGEEARTVVRERYDARLHVPRLADILRAVTEGGALGRADPGAPAGRDVRSRWR